MQLTSTLIFAIAAAAPVLGNTAGPYDNTTSVITRTVTAYETYCPKPTTFTEGTKTYTATKDEWVTVKHCPMKCTITYNPSNPTVVPVGEKPKYNNGTIPACPCPKGKKDCPCASPGTNGTTPGGNGTPGSPGTPGTSGNNPSENTPGSNGGSNDDNTLVSASTASTISSGALLGLAAVAVYML
ncbi:hypothetical protein ONS95_007347 [Cadophora gregata]|uniref:uncharacterized protein n=1 Tax=Cadophora gregata TaxID=51156 RepID=UPI0026DCFC45|nr:uncharacterized protein ONS95_007347 [Cadophora gregata]KAK0100903.1 hypothetical protein ONS95_007347 [Cadophora gregata]KAK0117103.1 hypothetical protein ONS96_012939 [Cadophora gregata f. sp. sojae]